jgi:hypothetical protein
MTDDCEAVSRMTRSTKDQELVGSHMADGRGALAATSFKFL